MKKIIAVVMLCVMAMGMVCPEVKAQEDVMKQAMQGYKNVTAMTAKVKKTSHNAMVTKDVVTTGTFYFKKPMKVCISTNGGKDMLVTDGTSFTLVENGKASTTNAKSNSALAPLVKALQGIVSGNEDTDLSDVADVDMERDGDKMIMTIVPIVQKAADKKKMLYQSFELVIDTKAGELRSVKLNGKNKNWDLYEFTGYDLKAKVDDGVFKV